MQVREAQELDALAISLEQLGGPVSLDSREVGDMLEGKWRMVYSSGFNSGSLGGRRPGPSAALVPFILGQVYQNIDSQTVSECITFIFVVY